MGQLIASGLPKNYLISLFMKRSRDKTGHQCRGCNTMFWKRFHTARLKMTDKKRCILKFYYAWVLFWNVALIISCMFMQSSAYFYKTASWNPSPGELLRHHSSPLPSSLSSTRLAAGAIGIQMLIIGTIE